MCFLHPESVSALSMINWTLSFILPVPHSFMKEGTLSRKIKHCLGGWRWAVGTRTGADTQRSAEMILNLSQDFKKYC